MIKRRLLLVTLFCTTIGYSQNNKEIITNELTALFKKSSLAGFAVAILNKDKVLYSKGFGFSSRENKTLFTTKTVQPIASISKTFLAVALMKAQELGKLNLNDDINKHLPFKVYNPNFKSDVITIKQLANHTSSLKDGKHYDKTYVFDKKIPPFYNQLKGDLKSEIKEYVDLFNSNVKMSLEDFIRMQYKVGEEYYSNDNFLNAKPGTKYKYSNMGANIAALIIERATGVKYKDFVKREILEPLRMKNSGWPSKKSNLKNFSSIYWYGFLMPTSDLITYPDGNLMTNIDDFSVYFLTMIKGYFGEANILSSNDYKVMMKNPSSDKFRKGIFWSVDNEKIGHSGSDIGVLTHAYFLKESGDGIVVFVNTSDTEKGALEVRDIYRVLIKHILNKSVK
jgi:CubicO group peptidase (beta-lactamase class C family)